MLADAIVINSTLKSFNLSESSWPILNRYSIAIIFGSLISIIISGIIANDVYGKGEFSDWGSKKDLGWIIYGKVLSIFLIVSGLFVITSLGLSRYSRLVDIQESTVILFERLGQFVIHVLTPLNAGIAATLVAEDGFGKGLKIAIILIGGIIYLVGWIFAFAVIVIVSTIIFFFDILWRFLYAINTFAN